MQARELHDLLGHTLNYAEMLASRAPLPQRFAKEVIRRSMGVTLDEGLRMESASFHDIGQTEDLQEGTTAFRERRPAQFKGR